MITNERQYRITKTQFNKLKKAINEFNLTSITKKLGSEMLARAELDALKSESQNLLQQLTEYETLKSGIEKNFVAKSLSELPQILIRARIAQHLSQKQLAEILNLKEQQIQRYEAEYYSSASLKRLLEIANALNITITENAKIESPDKLLVAKKNEIDWGKFPIKEMYKRGWFDEFNGSLDFAIQESEILIKSYVKDILKKPVFTMHRINFRTSSEIDQYALFAWECRVIYLSQKVENLNRYSRELITSEWLSGLKKLSKFENGPLRAREELLKVGIPLIIEPHLKNTYLDGAAFLFNNSPIIGLTVRYDRLDNFWFVLMHELMHVVNHLQAGKLEHIFDDLDIVANQKIEIEADKLASEELIHKNEWENSLARYMRSKESVLDFADELGISPAIVAGKIRFEANNYIILNDLIGQGDVRKLFPQVNFGV